MNKIIIPHKKRFRFYPADYGTTYRYVKTLPYGRFTLMADEHIIFEYDHDRELLVVFFNIRLHILTPDEQVPNFTPQEQRNIRRYGNMRLFLFIVQVVIIVGSFIYVVFFKPR